MRRLILLVLTVMALGACRNNTESADEQLAEGTKIVSLNGAVSEVMAELGLADQVVGTDVTSNYPESIKNKPKVGHNRNINAEGVLALQPDMIVGIEKEVPPQLIAQFKAAGIKLILFNQEYSVQGTKDLIRSVGDSLLKNRKADSLIKAFDTELAAAQQNIDTAQRPGVLFIYARGTGAMMVGGTGTQVEKVIELAGGRNAIKEFADYKPLTAEALVKANPDVILLFDDGLESLGGANGLLDVQGIAQTNAGKNKKIITMQGDLLTSFGPRLGKAIIELSSKIK